MKMRRKTFVMILILVLGIVGTAIPAAAAETDRKNTEATVTFEIEPGPGGALLYMDNVPDFNFGTHSISPGDETYTVIQPFDEPLRVEDRRTTGAGWNVTATITGAFTSQTTYTPLNGSRIIITGGTITYGAGAVTPPPAPAQPVTITLDNSGGPALVLTADAGQGKGIWNDVFDVVELEVPGSTALAEAYKATILWTLNDVPG